MYNHIKTVDYFDLLHYKTNNVEVFFNKNSSPVFSANFGIAPPPTIASRLVLCNISTWQTLPTVSIPVKVPFITGILTNVYLTLRKILL